MARRADALAFAGLATALTLAACFPSRRGRAKVGDDVIPTPADRSRATGESPAGVEAKDAPAKPTAAPPVAATTAPVTQGPASQTHPFKGLAFGSFPLGTSEIIVQTGLKSKRSYWKVLKLAGEERYFVYPSLRADPTWLSVCDDEAQPRHDLYASFAQTLCRPGTSDAVTMAKDLALKVAAIVNNGLKFRYAAFYETSVKAWRVYPSPHFGETIEVCEEQGSGPLGPWCATFLKDPEAAEKRPYMLFETETEAKAMSASFNAIYGVP